jgi:hypothetical protein
MIKGTENTGTTTSGKSLEKTELTGGKRRKVPVCGVKN